MDEEIRAIVAKIHDSDTRIALAVSGAGSRALAWLLGVPGATRTVLEAVVPYGWNAMVDYLGWRPEKYAATSTAVSLAAAAYSRARHLREADERIIGVSCTASIATDYQKRGAHRCFVAIWDGETAITYALEMQKGQRDRNAEEEVCSQLVLHAVASGCGLADSSVGPPLGPGESIIERSQTIASPLPRLLDESLDTLTYYGPAALVPDEPVQGAILPGSFNPLHDGHRRLARAAERMLNVPLVFELSVYNVDKPALSIQQISQRLEQFSITGRRVALSREARYSGKATLFPASTFVIGFDTAVRLVDPRYYAHSPDNIRASLDTVREANCRFLVAGRLVEGRFMTLDDVPVPDGYLDMFDSIPEDDFRLDLTSTELRARSG